jgi:hypothetical protein
VSGDDLPALPRAKGIARSLREARPGHMLLVEPSGNVVGPRSGVVLGSALRLLGLLVAVMFVASFVGSALFGGTGALAGSLVAYVAALTWLQAHRRVGNALRRLGQDDLVGAERLALRAAESRIVSSAVRGNALYLAASARWLQGDRVEALALTRRALDELSRSTSPTMRPIAHLARLHEVQLLAIDGHLAEAVTRLHALRAPEGLDGDLVQLQTLDTHLVLAFESHDAASLPADLDPWTQQVLGTQRFGSTLVLLAWAHRERDELELSDALLEVARDRLPECHLDAAHPRLHAWLQSVDAARSREDA